jgi:hypothetical protein
VRTTVDQEATGTADTLTAVRREGEGLLACFDVTGVHVVEELQDGHGLDSVRHVHGLEVSLGVAVRLPPDFKMQFHYL